MQVFKCLSCNRIEKINDKELKREIDCPKCDGTMYRIVPKMKLGEILLSFEWITEEDLNLALHIQKQLSRSYPIGRVLKLTGKIEQTIIEKALEFQRSELEEKARYSVEI